MNKRNKEFNSLKISYNKLNEENKRNSKLIQEAIEEYERNKREGSNTESCANTINRLKEVLYSSYI